MYKSPEKMKPEIILKEKADKYFVYFDENQKMAILEAMKSYANMFKTEEKKDKAEFIINEIGFFYGLKSNYFKDTSRKSEIIKARQISMFFIRSFTKLSLQAIGSIFNKDHSTIIAALKNVNNYIETDKKYRDEVINLKLILNEKLENLF